MEVFPAASLGTEVALETGSTVAKSPVVRESDGVGAYSAPTTGEETPEG